MIATCLLAANAANSWLSLPRVVGLRFVAARLYFAVGNQPGAPWETVGNIALEHHREFLLVFQVGAPAFFSIAETQQEWCVAAFAEMRFGKCLAVLPI